MPSAGSGWVNGLEWMTELEAWSEEYEGENMVPDPANKAVGDATVAIGLTNIPGMLKPIGKQFALTLLSPQLRMAMLYETPSSWVRITVSVGIALRKFVLKHLLLPRPQSMAMPWFSEIDPTTGRSLFEQYIGYPFYIKPTMLRRWGWKSWLLWLTGSYVPSSNKPEFRPEGYKIPDLGPAVFEGKGREEMEAAKTAILRMQGCPFHMN